MLSSLRRVHVCRAQAEAAAGGARCATASLLVSALASCQLPLTRVCGLSQMCDPCSPANPARPSGSARPGQDGGQGHVVLHAGLRGSAAVRRPPDLGCSRVWLLWGGALPGAPAHPNSPGRAKCAGVLACPAAERRAACDAAARTASSTVRQHTRRHARRARPRLLPLFCALPARHAETHKPRFAAPFSQGVC